MLYLVLLAACSFPLTSAATVSGVMCPMSCDCRYVTTNNRKLLQVTCYVPDLNSVRLGALTSVNERFSLALHCDTAVPYDITSERFTSYTMMEELTMSNCKVSFIHRNAFAGLDHLHTIRIASASNFHLSVHENAFLGLSQLQIFEMTGCGLLQLPQLCSLKYLKAFNVSNNSLSLVRETGLVCGYSALNHLALIDISNNKFKTLTEFKQHGDGFPNLQTLIVNKNQVSLTKHDTIFDKFKKLRIVKLSRNNISDMPDKLLESNHLMAEIDLSYNDIYYIPEKFFSYSTYWLRLNLQHNALDDAIWTRLTNVKRILYLDLSGNFLINVNQTAIQDMTKLIHLDLSENRIVSIDVKTFQNLQNLHILNLAGNQIHSIDNDALYGLLSLTILRLENNRIYTINQNVLNDVESLTSLNLSSNFLQELPSLKKVPSLFQIDASNNRLSNLPSDLFIAQRYIHYINLSWNIIDNLPDELFQSCESLITLDLSENNIYTIQQSLFAGIKLEKLLLQENRIEIIGNSFIRAEHLQELNLSHNQISDTLNRYMFPNSLVMIDLSYNNILYVRPYAFYGLDQIRMVDLRNNQISTLSEDAFSVSTSAYAQTGFYIDENPLICDCELLWLKKWDQSTRGPFIVNINNTKCSGALDHRTAPILSIPEERFLCYYENKCPSSCRCCGFTHGCDCKSKCPTECDCYSSEDFYSVHYVRCNERNLTTIERFLPRMATRMDLSGNDIGTIQSHSFIGLTNLTALFLNSSGVQKIENRSFVGLISLKRLYLDHNYIKSLLAEMFTGLPSIEKLYLDNNLISEIRPGVFDNMHSLKVLHLSNNYLQQMDDYLSHLVFTIPHLTMFANPWSCDCIMYFSAKENPSAYLNMSTIAVTIKTSSINCSVPNLQGVGMAVSLNSYGRICEGDRGKYIPEGLTREEKNTSTTVVNEVPNVSEVESGASMVENAIHPMWNLKLLIPIMIGVTLLIILLISIMCRKDFIKCYLFTKYRCKSSDNELLYDKSRHYDAFISYHQRDDPFVLRELAVRLERGKHKYHLLVHHRDCPPRSSVTQFIENGVKSSHRTILVLSNDFILENSWLKFIINCVKQDSIRRLVIITTGKIDTSKLDPVLKSYLETGKHLRYGERWFWDKLHYCLPEPGKVDRAIMRAEAHPYASTDLARLSTSVRDNQAYEEPMATLKSNGSMSSRPLPTLTEYIPSSSTQSYEYTGGSQQSSNIYEEIKEKDPAYAEAMEGKYEEPWKDLVLSVDLESQIPKPVPV